METQFVIRKIVEGLYLFFENSDNDTFAEKKATLPLHKKNNTMTATQEVGKVIQTF